MIPVTTQVTVAQVISASATVKTYVEKNGVLPATVTVGSYTVSIAQFAYLESEAIKALNSKKAVTTKINVVSVTNGSVEYTFKKDISVYDILVISNNGVTSMVPNINEFVLNIDVMNKRIDIKVIEGL